MPSIASDAVLSRWTRIAVAALLLAAAACSYVPPPAFPRAPLPLPEDIAQRYALPAPPNLRTLEEQSSGSYRGELECGGERILFHLQRCPTADRPLVLLVPILAGGEDLMRSIARRVVAHGFHVAWCERVGSAMALEQRGPQLEQLFRRTVIHQRALVAWLRGSALPQPTAIFALGVSMGGIISSVLAAVEPQLAATAVCLAGADLPSIVLDSEEARVVRWRDWRMTADGIGRLGLRQELDRELLSDPGRLGPFVDADRVLLVHATMDEVIRRPHQDLLWESMGRPRRLLVPLGHTTAALAIDSILDAAAQFFRERQPALPTQVAGA